MSSQADWMNQQLIIGPAMQQSTYGLHSLGTAKETREFVISDVRRKIERLRSQLAEVPSVQQRLQDMEAFLAELTHE